MNARLLALSLAIALAANLAACTKPNPATCCLDQADCSANGFNEIRECAPGLACVKNECEIPKCSTAGCTADVPVCNITTDVCEGCAASGECSRFTNSPVCDTPSGQCVQCVGASDCSGTTPICDNQMCRGCRVDADCPSGACGDNGACVAVDAIVYLDPAGTDTGMCTVTNPCRSIGFGATRTTALRNHIVMKTGGYTQPPTTISAQTTSASTLYLHGGGATISLGSGETSVLEFYVGAVVRHLTIDASGGGAAITFSTAEPCVAEDVTTRRGYTGISSNAPLTLRDVRIEDAYYGIFVTGGQLAVERGIIRRGFTAILASNASVQLSNLLIYGTSDVALDLSAASGVIESTTIADSGADTGTGARALRCGGLMTLRSSIIWLPGNSTRPPFQGCNVVSSIAGPNTGPGAMNVDPKFENPANRDYHIQAISPARDAVDTGPATDFEGDARPRGLKFDIGADEAP